MFAVPFVKGKYKRFYSRGMAHVHATDKSMVCLSHTGQKPTVYCPVSSAPDMVLVYDPWTGKTSKRCRLRKYSWCVARTDKGHYVNNCDAAHKLVTCNTWPGTACNKMVDDDPTTSTVVARHSSITVQHASAQSLVGVKLYVPPVADGVLTQHRYIFSFDVECFSQNKWHRVYSVKEDLARRRRKKNFSTHSGWHSHVFHRLCPAHSQTWRISNIGHFDVEVKDWNTPSGKGKGKREGKTNTKTSVTADIAFRVFELKFVAQRGADGVKYLGCYEDDKARDLKHGPKRGGYTPASCKKACPRYKYFALQAGSWCNCDNTYGTPANKYSKAPDHECNRGGAGYGGGWRNAIYKAASSTGGQPSML